MVWIGKQRKPGSESSARVNGSLLWHLTLTPLLLPHTVFRVSATVRKRGVTIQTMVFGTFLLMDYIYITNMFGALAGSRELEVSVCAYWKRLKGLGL